MANVIASLASGAATASSVLQSTNSGVGECFTANGATLGYAAFWLQRVGALNVTVTAKIYAITGSFGTTAVPTGAALATSDGVNSLTIPTASQVMVYFNFSGVNQITLTNGTNYFITVEATIASNSINVGRTAISAYPGNLANNSAGWAAQATQDMVFYVWDNINTPLAVPNNYQQLKVGDGMSTSEKIR